MVARESQASPFRALFSEELAITSRKLRTLFDARVRARGLTLARARTLMHLARKDGMTQTELAEILEIEGPTLVRLLDGLEKQGLIERQPVAGDRRAKQIALTYTGREQAAQVSQLVEEIRNEVLTDVSEVDLLTAIRIFKVMAQNITSATGCQTDAA
jgi:MarR family transcriptional regulator for hemolysin